MVLKVVTFKIEDELLERLERLANQLGVTRSQLIRDAVRQYVNEPSKHGVYRLNVKVRKVSLL